MDSAEVSFFVVSLFHSHYIHYDIEPPQCTRVTIRRTNVFKDGFTHLSGLGKRPIAINFIDEHGLPEAGFDGGGLFTALLMIFCKRDLILLSRWLTTLLFFYLTY